MPVLDTGIFTARLHIVYPMLFKLTNSRLGRNTHCGVLEFVADEGKIYLPYWVSWCVNIVSPTFFVVNNVFYRNFLFAQANINSPYLCSALLFQIVLLTSSSWCLDDAQPCSWGRWPFTSAECLITSCIICKVSASVCGLFGYYKPKGSVSFEQCILMSLAPQMPTFLMQYFLSSS